MIEFKDYKNYNNFTLSSVETNISARSRILQKCVRCGSEKSNLVSTLRLKKEFSCSSCDSYKSKSVIDVRIEILNKTNGELTLIDEVYLGTNQPHKFLCNVCGRIKDFKPNHILSSNRKCTHKDNNRINNSDATNDDSIKSIGKLGFSYIGDKNIKINRSSSIQLMCNTCGFTNKTTLRQLEKSGCNNCKEKKEKNIIKEKSLIEQFMSTEKSSRYNIKEFVLKDNETLTRKSKVIITHNECGNTEETSMDNVLNSDKEHCSHCKFKVGSKFENEIIDIINEFNINYIRNFKLPDKTSIDIYFPELKFGIELNGDYWHSETVGRDKFYHFNKKIQAEKVGIHIFNIFQFKDFVGNEILVKNMIYNKLLNNFKTIFGRNTYVCEEKDVDVCNNFFLNNHLNGSVKNAKCIFISLRCKKTNVILSIISVSKARFKNSSKYNYELIRFASLRGFNIVGGFSKLLKHFMKFHMEDEQTLMTFSDLNISHSVNNVYEKCDVRYVEKEIISPSFYYFKNNKCFSRHQLQKSNIERISNFVINEELSLETNCKLNGFHKVWNCGNVKYVFKKSV